MRKSTTSVLTLLLALIVTPHLVRAQNCIGLAGSNPFSHTQNFDALGIAAAPQNGDSANIINLNPSGTPRRYLGKFDNAVADGGAGIVNIPGWALFEEGTNITAVSGRYGPNDGSTAGPNTFSFGNTADRAFGSITEATGLLNYVGGCFQNTGTTTVTNVVITFTGEMWRRGAAGAHTDIFNFEYAINATNLYEPTLAYLPDNDFDFVSPNILAPAGALDGNLALNRTEIGPALLGVSLAPGDRLYIRWRDDDLVGIPDDGLAIDDVTVSFLSPSAAPVELTGRVYDAAGRGIVRAQLTLQGLDGSTQYAVTNQFGYYRFPSVAAGTSYTLSVAARGRTFQQPSVVIEPSESLEGIDFIAGN